MKPNISQHEKETRMQSLRRACRDAGLPLTSARHAIFAYLAGTTSHPSAQEIFSALKKDHPSLSLATVYNNLETFARLGIAEKITLQAGVIRWDADMRPHHHLVREGTQEIRDIHDELDIPLPASIARKNLNRVSATFYVK